MFGRTMGKKGAVLLVSIGPGDLSLGIAERSGHSFTIRTALSASLSPERREKEQIAAALKQLIEEKGAALTKTYGEFSDHHKITSMFVVLHAPIASSQIIASSRVFDHEQEILDELLDECARTALDDLSKRPDFLSARMLQVRLNGYPASSPEGKRAQEVEVIGLVSSVETAFKEPLFTSLQRVLPGGEMIVRAGSLALANVGIERKLSDGTIIFLSTEGTEIVIMRSGVISTCSFVPVGMHAIAEKAGQGAPAETILSAMRLTQSGKGSEAARDESESALAAIERDIAKSFGEAFAALSSPIRLPGTVLLLAPPEMAEWFSRFLTRIDFAPFTLMAQPFEVTIPMLPDLDQAPGQKNIDLTIAAMLAEREQQA